MKTKILCLIALGIFFVCSSTASAATQITLSGTNLSGNTTFRTIAVGEGLGTGIYNHFGNTVDTAAKLCALTQIYWQSLGLDKPYPVYVKKTAGGYTSCWNDYNHVWKSGGWVTEGACKIGSMITSVTCGSATIACTSNASCGTDGPVSGLFCKSDGNVYQTQRTFTCNNLGTASSYCSQTDADQLQTNCTANQTCSGGSCHDINIACSTNSQCGTSDFIGSLFCKSGNVYKTYRTYTCNNLGTASSYCSQTDADQLQQDCTANQTCSNGACLNVNIACSSASDCGVNGPVGSNYCQGNSIYQSYRTWTCNSPGTTYSSCSQTTVPQLVSNCAANQTCSNGVCSNVSIACNSNSNCGNNGLIGSSFCQGNSVYQTYRTYTCNNAGAANSYCSNSDNNQLQNNCGFNQTCSNGSCQTNCTNYSYQQCSGNSLYWYDSCNNRGDLIHYCQNGCYNNFCQNYNNITVQTNSTTNISNTQATLNGYLYGISGYNTNYVWFQWGTTSSYGYETNHQTQNYTGSFGQNIAGLSSGIVYHFRAVAQGGNSQTVYGQDMTFTTSGSTGNLLTINKTARNMSSGDLSWFNTVYANPSDMLMFMITIRASGSQNVNNVFARDILPANLIYNNQLVVSGSSNYSGDITSGINLGAISAGQTVTITYQAQVAAAQNFSYGTTTLNNNVNVTSSGSNYNPTSNAVIVVTRSAVYGATTINTGLTDNLLVDSFLLPLMAALAGIWMFKSGMFFKVEKWVDLRKSMHRNYKAQKELRTKIAQIKQIEKQNKKGINTLFSSFKSRL